ncbi:hypothetical protein HPP92_013250 [Vanilla planifolia]|uniref:Uncharacterized protein n=1 Tax=Vanilla planifolia TaxID=51239 RepID=A0A835UUM6_VANPL|nr:hypothetical protein HPP92_013250 [Vanilla planifolia]
MMSCLSYRRRRREKALRAPGEEHKVAFAEVEHFLKSSKNRRSPQWRPTLSTISEDRTAISGGSSLQTAPGSTVKKELVTKPSRRATMAV